MAHLKTLVLLATSTTFTTSTQSITYAASMPSVKYTNRATSAQLATSSS